MISHNLKSLLLTITLLGSTQVAAEKIAACETQECVSYFKTFKHGANRGHPDAMATLAQFYYYGYGTKENKEKAFIYFKKAAKLGSISAIYKTGLIYLSDEQRKDLSKGARYIERAAKYDYVSASFLLSVVYINKTFGLYDPEKADIYLAKSYKARHQDMPVVISYLEESAPITDKNFPKLYAEMNKTPLVKKADQYIGWPDDETEVITITSPPLKTLLDQQIVGFRRPIKSLGSRLPSASCRDTVGCYTTGRMEGLADFPPGMLLVAGGTVL